MRLVTSKFDEFSLTIPTGIVPFPVASGAAVEFPADVTADEAVAEAEEIGTEVCLRLTFSLEESRKLTWLTAWPFATCKSHFKKKKTFRKNNNSSNPIGQLTSYFDFTKKMI